MMNPRKFQLNLIITSLCLGIYRNLMAKLQGAACTLDSLFLVQVLSSSQELLSTGKWLASFPGLSLKESLVHTVCACAKYARSFLCRCSSRYCFPMATSSMVCCRFCLKEDKLNHAVAIFSSTSLRKDAHSLLEYIYDVKIRDDDGRSKYACRSCFSTAHNTHKKLQKLRALANSSYEDATPTTGNSYTELGSYSSSIVSYCSIHH